jgi:hypothetical protein
LNRACLMAWAQLTFLPLCLTSLPCDQLSATVRVQLVGPSCGGPASTFHLLPHGTCRGPQAVQPALGFPSQPAASTQGGLLIWVCGLCPSRVLSTEEPMNSHLPHRALQPLACTSQDTDICDVCSHTLRQEVMELFEAIVTSGTLWGPQCICPPCSPQGRWP